MAARVPEGYTLEPLSEAEEFVVSATSYARWVVASTTLKRMEADNGVTEEHKKAATAGKKIHHKFALSGGAPGTTHTLISHSRVAAGLAATPARPETARLVVADMKYRSAPLPGQLIRKEPPPSTSLIGTTPRELDGNAAFENSKTVRDFYSQVLGRNSIDGKGEIHSKLSPF
jgi:Zn-dependent metalloprotease